ncbi:hypothetical protein CTI14_70555, partial [Methylobacterium radiotolerans]
MRVLRPRGPEPAARQHRLSSFSRALTINAFTAANEVFIPIQCEYYALEGLSQLLGSI